MSVVGHIKNSTKLIIFIVIFQSNCVVWAGVSTIAIGSDYGNVTRVWPLTIVKEIGLTTLWYQKISSQASYIGRCVGQVKINGVSQGRKGDRDLGSITLGRNEYISKIVYKSAHLFLPVDKSCITVLKFTTNSGRSFGYEDSENSHHPTIQNVRVLAIGGETSSLGLEKLNIMYIDEYQPSITEATNVGFIVAYSPPFAEFEEYTNTNYKTIESYEKATEHMMTQSYSSSIEFEFLVKVSASVSIEIKDTSMEKMRNEFEKELQLGVKRKQTIPEEYVGIKLIMGELMKGPNETYWMYPTTGISYSVIKITEISGLLGCYDLTGVLYTQMQNLKQFKTIEKGYVYYAENNSSAEC